MGVEYDQFGTSQAPAGLRAQELRPNRLGLRSADLHAQNFAPTVTVDADSNYNGDRDNAPATANLQIGGVDSQIWPVALDRPVQEGLDLAVDLLA